MIFLRLFFEFFKTGLFSIGGGLATVPFLSDLGSRTGYFFQKLVPHTCNEGDKEYDWGIKYVQLDGMCEMAAKIIS